MKTRWHTFFETIGGEPVLYRKAIGIQVDDQRAAYITWQLELRNRSGIPLLIPYHPTLSAARNHARAILLEEKP